MKSLRDLLLALLTALRSFLLRTRALRAPRPVHGPAHPRVRPLAAPPGAPEPAAPARPPRASLPPHLAALLARAPDVEPEFVRLPAFVRRVPATVRIYSPRPAAPVAPTRPAFARVAFAPRVARALDHVREWIVHASPARRVRAASSA